MFLRNIQLVNFKNYPEANLLLSPEINCFTGKNGSGKTNFLDAVHYLANCKSFLPPADSQNIRNEASFFLIEGSFEKQGKVLDIFCGLKKGQKKSFRKNKKEYEKLSEHLGLIPLVLVSPSDQSILIGGGEERRKFLDSFIAVMDPDYLRNLILYINLLSQKNSLLKKIRENKNGDQEMLDVYDSQMEGPATEIFLKRQRFCQLLMPEFIRNYQNLSSGKEEPQIAYKSALLESTWAELMVAGRERDSWLGYSGTGIHRDDLEFMLDGKSLKKFGSQGQQKTALLALKLAQFNILKENTGTTPLLLLDDLFAHLDEVRIRKMLEMVGNRTFGQVFITDANAITMKNLFSGIDAEVKMFTVKNGEILDAEYVGQ
jgi:DNA replication and repair protein RecF